jgi:RimJ/RimL family protein N-acetyltransferase
MENVTNRSELAALTSVAHPAIDNVVNATNWRLQLPVLTGKRLRLRELRSSDARQMLAILASDETTRYISPPPTTLEGFQSFVNWASRQRSAGAHACFVVTLRGSDTPIGIFQVTRLDETFATAEWGFVLGPEFWGTGLFREGAELLLDFAFETMGVHRLEARAALLNGRGNGALLKVGAVPEAILKGSFWRHGQALDQMLYSIHDDDWRTSRSAARPADGPRVH